jgi:hypothetical protein
MMKIIKFLLGAVRSLRRDGWLLQADGAVEPAFDHVAMKIGQVYVVKEGVAVALTQTKTFPSQLV